MGGFFYFSYLLIELEFCLLKFEQKSIYQRTSYELHKFIDSKIMGDRYIHAMFKSSLSGAFSALQQKADCTLIPK